MSNQFGRDFSILVSDKSGKALDLSKLHTKFSIKKSGIMTPNVADIRIYNLKSDTQNEIINKEYTRVIINAGYVGNSGRIFSGNIKQTITGRENSTDTFLDIVAGDGDQAYNFAVVNKTIGGNGQGVKASDQISAATDALGKEGIGKNYIGATSDNKLPRGKSIYANARDVLRSVSDSQKSSKDPKGFTWSIQDEQVVFLSQGTFLPGEVVILNSKTGMIGTPQQTILGVSCKCLLNPKIKVHSRIQIDNKSVEQYKLNFQVPGSPANTPVPLSLDGVYYVFVAEHTGDNRGLDWYTNLVLLVVNPSDNPINDIPIGGGV